MRTALLAGPVAAGDPREDEATVGAYQAWIAGAGAVALAGGVVLDAARPVEFSRVAGDGGGVDAAAVVELAGVPAWIAVFGEHLDVDEFKVSHVFPPVVGLRLSW